MRPELSSSSDTVGGEAPGEHVIDLVTHPLGKQQFTCLSDKAQNTLKIAICHGRQVSSGGLAGRRCARQVIK